MPTVTKVTIDRSGPAIRASLAEHAPTVEHRFTAELRTALARAADDLDRQLDDSVDRCRAPGRYAVVRDPPTVIVLRVISVA